MIPLHLQRTLAVISILTAGQASTTNFKTNQEVQTWVRQQTNQSWTSEIQNQDSKTTNNIKGVQIQVPKINNQTWTSGHHNLTRKYVFDLKKSTDNPEFRSFFTSPTRALKIILDKILSLGENESTQEDNAARTTRSKTDEDAVRKLSKRWAPLVFLAPGEQYMPDSVERFLKYVSPVDGNGELRNENLPLGANSKKWYLEPDQSISNLLENKNSFLYGKDPQKNPVPIYAVISRCNSSGNDSITRRSRKNIPPISEHFHVTYWFFYPFNEGKNFCTWNLSFMGKIPIPPIFSKCIGNQSYYGNHVGDWEHISLYFSGHLYPSVMYVSTHDVGAFYNYDSVLNQFNYTRQDSRKAITGKTVFPNIVKVKDGHPLLFSAKGSHGFWSAPGKHKYFRVPRLLDETGFGVPWETWRNVKLFEWQMHERMPRWMGYLGHWGTRDAHCLPLKKLGIDVCQISPGPTGIPLKRINFNCPKN